MITQLALGASAETTRLALTLAADRRQLRVIPLTSDPQSVLSALSSGPGTTALRAPGGLLAAAVQLGAEIRLFGATPEWFCALPISATGREWELTDARGALELLENESTFVKLANAKHPLLPARRYTSGSELEAALRQADAPLGLRFLVTQVWLDIHSEYRVFCLGNQPLTVSPYLVEDDPWSPLLHTHRASFHAEALSFAAQLLQSLTSSDLPPTAVLDVARLSDGRFVLLEVNDVWSAALYGCDPDLVLAAILGASGLDQPDELWLWRPDPAAESMPLRRLNGG